MRKAILIPNKIGIGDAIQFTSLPENYFKSTGKKLVDYSRHWVFDHNPYITREYEGEIEIVKLWDKYLNREYEKVLYRSNAEIWAKLMGVTVHTRRPNLYLSSNPEPGSTYMNRLGISQGTLTDETQTFIEKKYHATNLPFCYSMWELVDRISKCEQIISPFSGPCWIAACFPNITVKAVFAKGFTHVIEKRIPLSGNEQDSLFDDYGLFKFYNQTERDIGYTESYLKL